MFKILLMLDFNRRDFFSSIYFLSKWEKVGSPWNIQDRIKGKFQIYSVIVVDLSRWNAFSTSDQLDSVKILDSSPNSSLRDKLKVAGRLF